MHRILPRRLCFYGDVLKSKDCFYLRLLWDLRNGKHILCGPFFKYLSFCVAYLVFFPFLFSFLSLSLSECFIMGLLFTVSNTESANT